MTFAWDANQQLWLAPFPGYASIPPDGDTQPPGETLEKPGAPTSLQAVAGVESATVSWAAPLSDGGAAVTSYRLSNLQAGEAQIVSAANLQYVWSALPAGTPTQLAIEAVNSQGRGPQVQFPSVTPLARPSGGQLIDGWDPTSLDTPPRLSRRAFHNNTGLCNLALQAPGGLKTHSGDLTTNSNNQVIDGLLITGALVVQHTGVTIKNCWIKGGVKPAPSAGTAGRMIHCDLGYGDAGDKVVNGLRGFIHTYRCLFFGQGDSMGFTSTGYINTSTSELLIQDNCFHSARMCTDPARPASNQDYHNDYIQGNYIRNLTIRGNTFLCWTINNYTASESCTRSTNPHWTDTNGTAEGVTPKDTGRSYAFNKGSMNAGMLYGGVGPVRKTLIEDNYFRGLPYSYIFASDTDVTYTIRNNVFAKENVSGRPIIAGLPNVQNISGNKYTDGTSAP